MAARVHRRLRRGSVRCLAASLVVLLAAAQLSTVAHMAAVAHVTCAEHGESVELASSDADGHEHAIACLHATDEGAAHHDHCQLASVQRTRALGGSAPAAIGPAPSTGTARAALLPSAPALAIAVLRLAPKNSPPA